MAGLVKRHTPLRTGDRGFAAVIVVLMLIMGAGAFTVYLVAGSVDADRERRARTQLAEVFKATLRFTADIGRLPTALSELTSAGALPSSTTSTQMQIKMGWSGPYLMTGFDASSLTRDPWGRALKYSTADSLLAGQISSTGRDGIAGNTDDIKYPAAATTATGSLVVDLVIWNSVTSVYDTNPTFASDNAQATSATLYYPVTGAETSTVIATSGGQNPPYTFANVPMGRHALRVTSSYKGANPAMTTTVSVDTLGNGRVDKATVRLTSGGVAAPPSEVITCEQDDTCTCSSGTACTLNCGEDGSGKKCDLRCNGASSCAVACGKECEIAGQTTPTLSATCAKKCELDCGTATNCTVSAEKDSEINCASATNCTVTCLQKCELDCGNSNCTVASAGNEAKIECSADCTVAACGNKCELDCTDGDDCTLTSSGNEAKVKCGSGPCVVSACGNKCEVECQTASACTVTSAGADAVTKCGTGGGPCAVAACGNKCDVRCESSSSCTVGAMGDDAKVLCDSTAGACQVTSCGKKCELKCEDAATCSVGSAGDDADIHCGDATTCSATCTKDCKMDCQSASPCTLTCLTEAFSNCGGNKKACGGC